MRERMSWEGVRGCGCGVEVSEIVWDVSEGCRTQL